MVRNVAILTVLTLGISGGWALADISPDPEYGQSLSPRERTAVAMTEETVTVTLGQKGARVDAVFFLKNTGKATSLEVGFPDVARAGSMGGNRPPSDFDGYKLKAFEAKVDGKVVKHTYKWVKNQDSPREKAGIEKAIDTLQSKLKKERNKKARIKIERELAWKKKTLGQWAWYGWLVWDMAFRRGQTTRVEVSYTVPYRPPYRPTHLRKAHFEYVLKTGSPWKGPIGRALIEVRFSEGLSGENIVKASPEGFTKSDTGLTWDLKNIEPTEDIRIDLNKYATYQNATQMYLADAKKAMTKDNIPGAALLLGWAAECQEKAKTWAPCIETCRRIIEMELKARGGQRRGIKYVKTWWKAGYVPWECKIATCYEKLGKMEEAKKAAVVAIAACRAILESKDRSLRRGVNEKLLAEKIKALEAIAGG